MKKVKQISLTLLLFILVYLQGCALWYSAEPIEGWVIDANTKQPLKDVIVIANWELVEGGFGGNVTVGQIMIMESVTDTNGRYSFLAWGPKIPKKGHLFTRDPQLLFFKNRYRLRNLQNAFHHEYRDPTLRKSEWNGKTIELEKFKGSLEEYAEHIDFIEDTIYGILFHRHSDKEDCNWKKTPYILMNLNDLGFLFESKRIKLKGWRAGQRIRKITDIPNSPHCGSIEEFFRAYVK